MITLLIGVISFLAAQLPGVSCRLPENREQHRWIGRCSGLFRENLTLSLELEDAIKSGRWRSDQTPTGAWAARLLDDSGNVVSTAEIEVYPDRSGILRTDRRWLYVRDFRRDDRAITIVVDTGTTVAPADLDFAIVRRAAALLSSTAVWNRHDDRNCPPSATTWSIYCAMQRATIDVSCGAHHRRPAMEAVREIVDERWAGRSYQHRLMDYNNDSATTIADVQSLFDEALQRMRRIAPETKAKTFRCSAAVPEGA